MLAAALHVPAFPQSSNPREIPFENSRLFGLVLIKVEVNGKLAVLIVDTASNHTIISSELADVPARNLDDVVATSKGSGFAGAGVFTRVTLKVGPSPGAITRLWQWTCAPFQKAWDKRPTVCWAWTFSTSSNWW
jgi:hypothetical protein